MSDIADALERAKALEDYDEVRRIKAELAGDVVPVDDEPKSKRSRKTERATDAKPESR